MDEIRRDIERMALGAACKEAGIDEDIIKMMDCLVKNGCPAKCVLQGMDEFAEYLRRRSERDVLKELLKDLPIILEGE